MRRLSTDTAEKPELPKAAGRGEGVMVRLDPSEVARLDEWAAEQSGRPSRAEALHRLAIKMLDLLEPPIMRAPATNEQFEAQESPRKNTSGTL